MSSTKSWANLEVLAFAFCKQLNSSNDILTIDYAKSGNNITTVGSKVSDTSFSISVFAGNTARMTHCRALFISGSKPCQNSWIQQSMQMENNEHKSMGASRFSSKLVPGKRNVSKVGGQKRALVLRIGFTHLVSCKDSNRAMLLFKVEKRHK